MQPYRVQKERRNILRRFADTTRGYFASFVFLRSGVYLCHHKIHFLVVLEITDCVPSSITKRYSNSKQCGNASHDVWHSQLHLSQMFDYHEEQKTNDYAHKKYYSPGIAIWTIAISYCWTTVSLRDDMQIQTEIFKILRMNVTKQARWVGDGGTSCIL